MGGLLCVKYCIVFENRMVNKIDMFLFLWSLKLSGIVLSDEVYS